MSEPVFLDSGIFIALMSRKDRRHEQAVALFGGPTPKWPSSILVISETYTWILHRMGEEQARMFRQFVDTLQDLRVLDATHEHHAAVVRVLDRYRGAKLSYTDASSLAHLEQRKIKRMWSTDHHLGLSGAKFYLGRSAGTRQLGVAADNGPRMRASVGANAKPVG